MIGYLKGTIVDKRSNFIIIDVNGVGYKVYLPNCPKSLNESVELYIHQHIREDANDLYGFLTSSELEVFELLIQVAGVGPKLGQTILQTLGKNKILGSIEQNDAGVFKTVSGVGSKVAAKIIVELKSKISGSSDNLLPEEDETLEALVSLGYKKSEIMPYMQGIPQELTSVQEKIRFILSRVGKKRS
jgi:Holliday junction DNA helicase RuvA